jgi:chromosome segregation ATPase
MISVKGLAFFHPSLPMAAPVEHTHHIKIRSTQMEMSAGGSANRDEDYDRKLKDAQEELDRIQLQREELERKKSELEELTVRKRTFLSQQVELTEKLTSALTLIDRGLFEIRQEAEDLEQCRTCFAAHLDKIQKINPEAWSRDNLPEKLEKASMAIDIASDEYDQAAAHFEGTRSGSIFGRASKRSRTAARLGGSSEFMANLRNGFAFNLPIVVLGGVALLVYLTK